jgi:hypothetical protein
MNRGDSGFQAVRLDVFPISHPINPVVSRTTGKDTYGNRLKPDVNAYDAVNNPNYTRDNYADNNACISDRSFDGVDFGVCIYIHIRHVILPGNWVFYFGKILT